MAPTRHYKRGLQVIKENFTIERVTGYECVPGRQQTIYWDKKQQGLGLRVTASGGKSYVFEGRLFGKTVRITIGSRPYVR